MFEDFKHALDRPWLNRRCVVDVGLGRDLAELIVILKCRFGSLPIAASGVTTFRFRLKRFGFIEGLAQRVGALGAVDFVCVGALGHAAALGFLPASA